MKLFQESVPGRLLMVAVALPLGTGASVVWNPQGAAMMWIISSVFAGILLGIVALGLALEKFDRQAVVAILFLPPALLLYTPLVAVAGGLPLARLAMGFGAMMLVAVASAPTVSRFRLGLSPRATTRSA